MPMNYYNEIDPHAAAWLRELIQVGLIPAGDVDERSIADVQARDLKNYTQHHFFAGIGGWPLALQMAGWPESKPVCTASLPCQPFSQAGKQKGKQDERHLLPHFIGLVKRSHWRTILGEQVPAAIRHGWLDDLCADMECENYAIGSAVLTASGAGAPHIRQRLYWVAHARVTGLGNPQHDGHAANPVGRGTGKSETEGGVQQPERPDTRNGWSGCRWITCRDGKYRPIKPGIEPMAHGLAKRMVQSGDTGAPLNADQTREAHVMRLKGYGNAIVPQVAANFINAYMQEVGYG